MFAVLRRSRLIAILFLGSALLVGGVSARKLGLFSKPAQSSQPRVTNKTNGVRVSNVRRLDDGDVEVTLLNQSAKAIYAYTMVTAEKPTRKGVTVFATDTPVAPGESKSERIPAGNLNSEIILSAIYLEGGTAEGDVRDSEKLKQTMVGMKEQAKLAVQVLRDASVSREQDSARLLAALESRVASMSLKEESVPISRERESGKGMVKDRLLKAVRKLKAAGVAPGFDAKTQVADLIQYYERLAEKL